MNIIGSTRVIAAFPGCGKSTMSATDLEIGDLDSSLFDKAAFPGNYVAHIKERVEVGAAFVSSHSAVRDALVESGIDFWLVYPARECKAEYLQRYRERGSPEKFIELLDANWDTWISECETYPVNCRIAIKSGHFLSDVVTYNSDTKYFQL